MTAVNYFLIKKGSSRHQIIYHQEALFLCFPDPQGVVPKETPDVRSPQGPCCRHCVLSLSIPYNHLFLWSVMEGIKSP